MQALCLSDASWASAFWSCWRRRFRSNDQCWNQRTQHSKSNWFLLSMSFTSSVKRQLHFQILFTQFFHALCEAQKMRSEIFRHILERNKTEVGKPQTWRVESLGQNLYKSINNQQDISNLCPASTFVEEGERVPIRWHLSRQKLGWNWFSSQPGDSRMFRIFCSTWSKSFLSSEYRNRRLAMTASTPPFQRH